MFWEGCGYACQIEGKMDADLYVGILEDNLEDNLEYYGKERGDFTFQQDNDPKHKSKKAQTWFKDNNILTCYHGQDRHLTVRTRM
jgi:hypothetical protein